MRDIINQAMTDQGVTAYELAKRSGVDASTIGRYIRGERDVTAANVAKMLDALNLAVTRKPTRARKQS